MAGGRPTDYNSKIADRIIDEISNGKTVTQICKDESMPTRSTVWKWSVNHPEFSIRYFASIKNLGQCEVDDIYEVEQMLLRGEIDAPTANVLLTSKRWKASKFYDKMYGDKTKVESKNENLNMNVEVPLSDADKEILQRFGFKDVD